MMDDPHVFTGRRVWPRCFDRTCILGCYQVLSECQGGFVVTTGGSVRPVRGEALAGVSERRRPTITEEYKAHDRL